MFFNQQSTREKDIYKNVFKIIEVVQQFQVDHFNSCTVSNAFLNHPGKKPTDTQRVNYKIIECILLLCMQKES